MCMYIYMYVYVIYGYEMSVCVCVLQITHQLPIFAEMVTKCLVNVVWSRFHRLHWKGWLCHHAPLHCLSRVHRNSWSQRCDSHPGGCLRGQWVLCLNLCFLMDWLKRKSMGNLAFFPEILEGSCKLSLQTSSRICDDLWWFMVIRDSASTKFGVCSFLSSPTW